MKKTANLFLIGAFLLNGFFSGCTCTQNLGGGTADNQDEMMDEKDPQSVASEGTPQEQTENENGLYSQSNLPKLNTVIL